MATWIPNQPVYFGADNLCSDDEVVINQIVDNTDTTQFQFEIDKCISASDIMPDGQFADPLNYVLPENWSIADGVLCLTGSSAIGSTVTTGTSGTTILSLFTSGDYYKVSITVDSISAGGSVEVWIGADVIGTISASGTYDFYGFATNQFAIYGYPLVLVNKVLGTNICISNITAFNILTHFKFAIYTSADVYVTEIGYPTDATYFTFVDNTLTVTIDWAELGLSNNCYYICLLDPCENTNGQNDPASILNTTMTMVGNTTPPWNLNPLVWSSFATYVSGTYSGASGSLTQTDVFNSYTNVYTIEIDVTAGTGINLEVYFGTNLVGTITSIGLHSFSGIATGNFTLTILLTAGTGVRIDTVNHVDVSSANYTCNQQSNNFSLGSYLSNCTNLINACNNENGLGFNFNGSGFTPRIRLESKLKQSTYSAERTIFEDSSGQKRNIYFSGRKIKSLAIDLQPEYVHDFLRLLMGFDNFYIDGDLYAVEDDEYTVEYSNFSDDLGKVRIAVSKRTQNVKNINSTDSQNVCNLGVDYLLQANDLAYRIVQTDGYGIIING